MALTKSDVRKIIKLYDSGVSAPKISARMGITTTTVYKRLKKEGVFVPSNTGPKAKKPRNTTVEQRLSTIESLLRGLEVHLKARAAQ